MMKTFVKKILLLLGSAAVFCAGTPLQVLAAEAPDPELLKIYHGIRYGAKLREGPGRAVYRVREVV